VWGFLARWMTRSFDAVLTSFPEEQAVYARATRTARVRFVGHYLSDVLTPRNAGSIRAARERLGMADGVCVVGLMPGSRVQEVRRLFPEMIRAAQLMVKDCPTVRFVVPVAEPRDRAFIEREIGRVAVGDSVTVVDGPSHDAMTAANLLIVASGTASLEAALLGVPLVIVYKVSNLTYLVVRACIRLGILASDVVGLPNLILGRRAIPELIQYRVDGKAIAQTAAEILMSPDREREILEALAEAARRVSSANGAVARAASYVLEMAGAHAGGPSSQVAVSDPAITVATRLDAPFSESK
jgi:lipid-A-disaccharide synthase